MREIIREKLDRLDELFPPARLTKSKERWRRLWAGEEKLDRLPFMAGPIGLAIYDVSPAPERLCLYLDRCIARGDFEDDYIPSFFPGCRQGTMPNMFGVKEIIVDEDYTCERLFDKYEKLTDLPMPRIEKGSVTDGWLEMERYVLEETGGRFPIHVTDMQGPIDVAGQLIGYEQVFIAAYEDPVLFDRLLSATTEAFIMFWRAQRDLLGSAFVGTHLFGYNYMPDGFGVTASADSLVMFSGDFYAEHFQKYFERISAEFGGISVHSCGVFSAVIPSLMKTKGLRGINASQMTIRELAELGVDERVVIIGGDHIDTIGEMMRFVRDRGLRTDLTANGIWPVDHHGVLKPPEVWTDADRDDIKRKNDKLLACYM